MGSRAKFPTQFNWECFRCIRELILWNREPEINIRGLSPHRPDLVADGNYRPTFEPTPGFLPGPISDLTHGGPIGPKAICDDNVWRCVPFHCLLQKPQGCSAVSLLSDKRLKDFAFMIYCSPEIVSLATNSHENFIQMPPPSRITLHRSRALLLDRCSE